MKTGRGNAGRSGIGIRTVERAAWRRWTARVAVTLLLAAGSLALWDMSAYAAKPDKPGGGGGGNPEAVYTASPINPPVEATRIIPYGMNNLAQVVGRSYVRASGKSDGAGPAFIWQGGVSSTLPPLGDDPAASANAISDNGLIVGVSFGAVGQPPVGHLTYDPQPAWWQFDGAGGVEVGSWLALFPAEFPDDLVLNSAEAISDDGRYVLFYAQQPATASWYTVVAETGADASGRPTIVDWWVLEARMVGEGARVEVLGYDIASDDVDGVVRVSGVSATTTPGGWTIEAILWELDANNPAAGFQLTPLNPGDPYSVAVGVNHAGESVGWATAADGSSAGVFWDANLVLHFMPTLGGTRTVVGAINDDSFAVGWSHTSSGTRHAFIWDAVAGTMQDLNSVSDTGGVELVSALRVNNSGHVMVQATTKNATVYVVLVPK